MDLLFLKERETKKAVISVSFTIIIIVLLVLYFNKVKKDKIKNVKEEH